MLQAGEYGVEGTVGALGIPYCGKAGVFGPGEKTGRHPGVPVETLQKDGKRAGTAGRLGTAGGGPDGGMLGGYAHEGRPRGGTGDSGSSSDSSSDSYSLSVEKGEKQE